MLPVGVHSYTVKCYRETPGDAGCHDVPAFGDSLDDCATLAGQMLLAYHNSPKRTAAQKPTTAHLEDEHGAIVARIRATGPDAVARIAGPTNA
jgi:hypothetical protein